MEIVVNEEIEPEAEDDPSQHRVCLSAASEVERETTTGITEKR